MSKEDLEMLAIMTASVGEPKSHWIGNQWIPAEGSRLYTTDEMRTLFEQECTLFVGDSLQRRAAETLGIALKPDMMNKKKLFDSTDEKNDSSNATTTTITHTPDVQDSAFVDELFNTNIHQRGYEEHFILPPEDANASTTRACIATDWRPRLPAIQQFAHDFVNSTFQYRYGKITIVVAGSGIWEVHLSARQHTTAQDLAERVNDTIYALHEHIPEHVLVVFKSAGWCPNCPWKDNVTKRGVADNYKVWSMNRQAKETIEAIGSPNRVFIDWAREVLPRSIGELKIKSKDDNPYHYGLLARLQFVQLLTEVLDRRQPLQPDTKCTQSSGSSSRMKIVSNEGHTIDVALEMDTVLAIGALLFALAWFVCGKRRGTR